MLYSKFILFTSQGLLWFSGQELVLDLALCFPKNRCRQETE